FLDRMTLSFFPAHGEAVLIYDKAMRDRNRLLKDHNRDAGWYDALERQMAEAALRITDHRTQAVARILRAQAETHTAFPTAGLELTHPDAPLPCDADALRQAWARARVGDMQAGRTLMGPHRVDLLGTYVARACSAADCSTGEQKALLISLILANGRALLDDTGAAPILLLDEVAAHLDPDRRAALYDEICALGSQAWMTGTEQALFEALGPRADYLHVTTQEDVSQVAPA
ncbi:MAG: DNA replication and repair protein RecF, partial [Primorskyibacter sp.]